MAAAMTAADRARVTTFVAVPPDDAFDVFTREIDQWWRKGPRFRFGEQRQGVLLFEDKGVERRLVEAFDESGSDVFEIGSVLVWEPGTRLTFEWRGTNFVPGETTEVDVRFESAPGGTRVTLEHRGWDSLRADHPARHGLGGAAFTDMIGLHWGDLMTGFRGRAARAPRY